MIAARQPRVVAAPQLRAYLALAAAVALIVGAIWALDPSRADDGSGVPSVSLGGTAGQGVTPRVGELAPDFTLDSLAGSPISLAGLRGRPVIVNFWASWCPPCRGEMPDLEEIAREHRGDGLIVLAVNLSEEPAAVQRYADGLGLSVPIALDRGGLVAGRYNLAALPTSYFIDRQGDVRDLNVGALTARSLRTRLAKVLE